MNQEQNPEEHHGEKNPPIYYIYIAYLTLVHELSWVPVTVSSSKHCGN